MKTKRKHKKRKNPIGILFSLVILSGCLYATFAYKDVAHLLLSRVHIGIPQKQTAVTVKLDQFLGSAAKTTSGQAADKPRLQGVFTYSGRTYLCGSGNLICFDRDGKALWKKAFASSKPFVAGMGRQLIVADFDIGDVYLLDDKGTVLSKKLGLGGIADIKSDKGQMLIRLADEKAFVVCDMSFKELARVPIPEGNLVGWDFSPAKATVGMMFIDSDKSDLFSNIQFYGYDGKLSEAVNVLGSALYDMRFTAEGVSVIGDSGVQGYSIPGGKLLWKQEWPRTALGFAYNPAGMLAINTAGSDRGTEGSDYKNSLLVVDKAGKRRVEVENLDLEANRIRMTQDYTIVEGAGKVLVYDMQGNIVNMRVVGSKLKDLLTIDDRSMMLVYEDKIEWVALTL